jgi:lambda family phage portal protein
MMGFRENLIGGLSRIFGIKPKVSAKPTGPHPSWLREMGIEPGMSLPHGGLSAGRSGGSKWPYGTSTYSPSLTINHYAIRQQARDAYHETPQAKAIVDRYADTVVDTGLVVESEPAYQILGITPEEAEAWSEDVERRFHLWAQSKQCHRSQTMNLYQMQRLYAIMQQRDNDQFVRLFYDGGQGLQSPLQIEFYDPNQIRGDAFTSTYGPFGSTDGIERNPDGSEKAYKIWYMDASGIMRQATIPHMDSAGNYHMLHGFYSEYPGQTRGYSRLGHAIQEFEKITDFTSATITKAINNAMFAMAIENDAIDPSDPFEGVLRTTGGAGPASEQFAPPKSSEIDEVESLYTGTPNYTPIPEATLSGPGIGIFNLQRGDKIKELGMKAGTETFGSFIDSFTSYLCASTGMPLEVLLMKFSSNYSASRGTLILFWRIAQIWVNEMAADFLNPVFESWLTVEIAKGRVSAPGWRDPRIRAAWLNCHWIGSPMPNIDPQKTANADRAYVELGATTLERVARNLNGSSASGNAQKLAREYENLPSPPWGDWGKSIENSREE